MMRTQIPGKSKIGGFNSQPPESVPDSQWIEVIYHNEHGDVIGTGKEKVCKPYWH